MCCLLARPRQRIPEPCLRALGSFAKRTTRLMRDRCGEDKRQPRRAHGFSTEHSGVSGGDRDRDIGGELKGD